MSFSKNKTVKQNERGSAKRKVQKRGSKRGRGNTSFSGASGHRDMERRAEQQVYMKKSSPLVSKAVSYSLSDWNLRISQDFQEEKNGPENVFLNTKGAKKKEENYKCADETSEREREECV